MNIGFPSGADYWKCRLKPVDIIIGHGEHFVKINNIYLGIEKPSFRQRLFFKLFGWKIVPGDKSGKPVREDGV